jgi:hypothetical protein
MRCLNYLWRQAILRLNPSPIVVDETDKGDGTPANLSCQFSDFVLGDFRRGIENLVPAQGNKPSRLVGGDRV